jgi:hypothetical protein
MIDFEKSEKRTWISEKLRAVEGWQAKPSQGGYYVAETI